MRAHDIHAHFYPPGYVDVVRRIAQQPGRGGATARAFLQHRIITAVPTFLGSVDDRLRLMDRANIDIQVLSFASMNIWDREPATRSELVSSYNDGCAELVQSHPDRFRFLASLPLPHIDESIGEARRARTLPGFVGYSIPTHIDTQPIDSELFASVYAAMDEEPALVLAHPDGFCAPGALDDFGMEWAIGAPFEDTIAVVRLVAGGILDDFPHLTWIIPHLGGTLPFLLHRLLWRWELEASLLGVTSPRAEVMSRLLFDTANSSVETLAFAEGVLPSDRIVFGTDYPFVDPDDLTRAVRIVTGQQFPERVRSAILRDRLDPYLTAQTKESP